MAKLFTADYEGPEPGSTPAAAASRFPAPHADDDPIFQAMLLEAEREPFRPVERFWTTRPRFGFITFHEHVRLHPAYGWDSAHTVRDEALRSRTRRQYRARRRR